MHLFLHLPCVNLLCSPWWLQGAKWKVFRCKWDFSEWLTWCSASLLVNGNKLTNDEWHLARSSVHLRHHCTSSVLTGSFSYFFCQTCTFKTNFHCIKTDFSLSPYGERRLDRLSDAFPGHLLVMHCQWLWYLHLQSVANGKSESQTEKKKESVPGSVAAFCAGNRSA